MFSLGWMEMSIILIICVILVGPKELPAVIKTIKSVILNLKGLSKEFTKTVEEVTEFSEIKDIKNKYLIPKILLQKREKSWMTLLIKTIKIS